MDLDDLLRRAEDLIENISSDLKKASMEITEAIGKCSGVLNDHPDETRAYLIRGRAYHSSGILFNNSNDLSSAISDFNEVISHEPVQGYIERSSAYLTMGRYDLAISDATAAIVSDPTNPKAHFQRAKISYDLGNYDAALNDIDGCIHHGGTDHFVLNLKGVILIHLGRDSEALDWLVQAVRLDPLEPTYPLNIGVVSELTGNLKSAEKCYHETLKLATSSRLKYTIRGNELVSHALAGLRRLTWKKVEIASDYLLLNKASLN